MPGQLANRQHRNHLAISAEDRNAKEIYAIMNNENTVPVIFGRIDANLGSYFRMIIFDGRTTRQVQASPRGLFKQRKAHIRFYVGDIVAMEGEINQTMTDSERAAKKALIYEIVAKFNKKEAQILYKSGRIHKSVYKRDIEEDDDELFDYGNQSSDEEEVDTDEEHELNRGGRGSGGKKKQMGGGVGQAGRAHVVVKEALDDEAYKNTIHAEDDGDDIAGNMGLKEGEGGVVFSGGPDWGDAPIPGSAAAAASQGGEHSIQNAVQVQASEGEQEDEHADEHAEDSWNQSKMKIYDNWEDASDNELDIDNI